MSTVQVIDCVKNYGALAALERISLQFENGEFFGLLGPSGSGKTTLLRSIAGFIELDSGTILLDGADISRVPVHRRDIGMVFQNYALFPHMSVFDNVAFGLSVRKMQTSAIKQRVDEILALVRLGGLQGRKPKQLSGGQQQRVALARALVTRPKVLLLDEPLGALDKHLREEMQVELRRIQREVGITTIFVTHDQEEAMTLCDRIAILTQGKIVQAGAPSEVYDRPINRFAAGFLGVANFLDGKVVAIAKNEAKIELALGGLATMAAKELRDGDPVLIAVRPEKVKLTAGQASPCANSLAGTVTSTVFSGSSITYRIAVADQLIAAYQQNTEPNRFQPGDLVTLHWSAEHNVMVEP